MDAFLKHFAELFEELFILFGFPFQHLFEFIDDFAGDGAFDACHQGIFLQNFAGDVQGQVAGIHHTAEEAHIIGHQLFAVVGDEYALDVICSSGTYIRTLCADIGKHLSCGGAMASLRRLGAGGFDIANAVTVDQLEAMSTDEREKILLPIESLFEQLPEVRLPAFFEKLCRSGCEIYQKKLHTALPCGTRVRLCNENGHFFALGQVADYPDGSAIKSIKMFEI